MTNKPRFKLVVENDYALINTEIKPGDRICDFRGEFWYLVSFEPPRHAALTGKVYVVRHEGMAEHQAQGFYPSVFGLKIKEIKT